jgi:hypothetical protein
MEATILLDRQAVDRVVDIASVVLISAAAVLTALCGYQSGRWGGQQMRLYNVANARRIQSAQVADRGLALTAIDVNLFLNYINAVAAGDTRLAQFIDHRFRHEMQPAMKAWLATKPLTNAKAPSSPFVMPQYTLRTDAEARAYEAQSAANFEAAQGANRHSDDFLLLTVIFAVVSFLAGMSTKMSYPRHAIIVGIGFIALAYGLARLVFLPFL